MCANPEITDLLFAAALRPSTFSLALPVAARGARSRSFPGVHGVRLRRAVHALRRCSLRTWRVRLVTGVTLRRFTTGPCDRPVRIGIRGVYG